MIISQFSILHPAIDIGKPIMVSDADIIRRRFLFKLGFLPQMRDEKRLVRAGVRPDKFGRNVAQVLSPQSNPVKQLDEDLRSQHTDSTVTVLSSSRGYRSIDSDLTSSTNSRYESKPCPYKERGGVRFDPHVTAIFIPSHKSYSPDSRSNMYYLKEEMASNVVRNSLEFSYENRDWRKAVEEDKMYFLSSGKFIHPAHLTFATYLP